MKTLILAMMLAAAPKPDIGLIQKPMLTVDAGRPMTRNERRLKLLVIAEDFRATFKSRGEVVKLKDVYFAQTSSDTQDAAIVVMETADGRVFMNFFFYGEGHWQVLPTDFSTETGN